MKPQRPNRYKVMKDPSYKADQRYTRNTREIKHRRHLNGPRGTEAPRLRPQEGNDAPTPPSSRPKWSKAFAQSPTWIRYPQRRPQEGNDTCRHRRRWRRNAELSPGKTFTPRTVSQAARRYLAKQPKHDLGVVNAEASPTPRIPTARSSPST
jgi:hypothetical protein